MIGNAVTIAVGEPVAAAVLLVTRARHRKRSAFTAVPGDSEATDGEEAAVACEAVTALRLRLTSPPLVAREATEEDEQSTVAEDEDGDGRPPLRAIGVPKTVRKTRTLPQLRVKKGQP